MEEGQKGAMKVGGYQAYLIGQRILIWASEINFLPGELLLHKFANGVYQSLTDSFT